MSSVLRSLIGLSVCALLAVSVLACQTTRPTTSPPVKVFPLVTLNKNPDYMDALMQQIMNGQAAIIKIDKDYVFPLIFDLENDAAEVDLNNNAIELSFKQDMYLSISGEVVKLSRDVRNWHDIKDLPALKKLLAYNRGALKFSLSANPGNQVAIVMTIATSGAN